MKPHRLCMTHHLVLSYELHKKMEVYVSCWVSVVDLCLFFSSSPSKCVPDCFLEWSSGHTKPTPLSSPSSILLIMSSFCTGLRPIPSTCSQTNWQNVRFPHEMCYSITHLRLQAVLIDLLFRACKSEKFSRISMICRAQFCHKIGIRGAYFCWIGRLSTVTFVMWTR